MQRLRSSVNLRRLIRETELTQNDLIQPLFIKHGKGVKQAITSMPGQFQLSLDYLEEEIQEISQLNIPGVILFGIPEHKNATGSSALDDNGIIQQAIRKIKTINKELLVISDMCFCEYTDHGHCGVLNQNNQLDNDATLELLAKQSISHAKAGADIIAPSGMMDGMVAAIRQGLDSAGFINTPILSYAVKYASSLYGPFREAAEGAPQFGDRKAYQMDFANSNEALREAALDVNEGADMLIVKPAVNYMDVIYRIKQAHPEIPLGAYHVSGEFAMIKAAAANGWIDEHKVALEILTSIKRAGADFILTYYAKEIAELLSKSENI